MLDIDRGVDLKRFEDYVAAAINAGTSENLSVQNAASAISSLVDYARRRTIGTTIDPLELLATDPIHTKKHEKFFSEFSKTINDLYSDASALGASVAFSIQEITEGRLMDTVMTAASAMQNAAVEEKTRKTLLIGTEALSMYYPFAFLPVPRGFASENVTIDTNANKGVITYDTEDSHACEIIRQSDTTTRLSPGTGTYNSLLVLADCYGKGVVDSIVGIKRNGEEEELTYKSVQLIGLRMFRVFFSPNVFSHINVIHGSNVYVTSASVERNIFRQNGNIEITVPDVVGAKNLCFATENKNPGTGVTVELLTDKTYTYNMKTESITIDVPYSNNAVIKMRLTGTKARSPLLSYVFYSVS